MSGEPYAVNNQPQAVSGKTDFRVIARRLKPHPKYTTLGKQGNVFAYPTSMANSAPATPIPRD